MALDGAHWLFALARRPEIGTGTLSLWDCPASLLEESANAETADCVVRPAPIEPDQSPALASRDLSSLFEKSVDTRTCPGTTAVQTLGWLWLINTSAGTQDLLPAGGLIDCGKGYVDTFRARRIDRQFVRFTSVQDEKKSVISLPVS
jgi:hypothetical protein